MIKMMREKMRCSRKTLLPLVCLSSIMTYIDLIPSTIRNYIAYVAWILLLVECLLTCRIRVHKNALQFITYGLIFFAAAALLDVFSPKQYLSSSVVYSIAVSLLVFICGLLLGNKLNQDDVKVICRWYVFGAVIYTVLLIISTRGNFNLSSRQYLGFNKNSVGQILSSAATILMIGISAEKEKSNTAIRVILSILLIIIMFLIRARTCILCFSVSVIVMLMSRYTSRKVKKWVWSLLAVLVLTVLLVPGFRTVFFEKILFANRDATDLNALSSGRVRIYSQFFPLIQNNELIGSGARYYESFFLSVIIQFGIPIGLYLWGYVLYMFRLIKRIKDSIFYGWLLVLIAVSYSLNGVFEGLPPFGPGTKNYLLWLLLGFGITHTAIAARGIDHLD